MSEFRRAAAVPLLDLRRQHERLEDDLVAAFTRVLRSGHYILGPEVRSFEEECARLLGARHAIGTSSGTDSLLLALMALGVGPGDEVVCPTYTFFATAGAIWRTGARPVFVDCRPCCYNLDPDAVIQAITQRTRAIVPVHLFGQSADLGPVLEAAASRRIPVVEDAAQSFGATWRGRRVGTIGTFGCFSFFPSKNLGGLGDGGLLTTDDDALAERARILRAHGARPKYHHAMIGGNFRLDELQAALLRVKLPHLETYGAKRREHARRYTERLVDAGVATVQASGCSARRGGPSTGAVLLLPAACQESHVYNQYVVRTRSREARDALREHLAARGIGTAIYYPVPMHEQPCFSTLRHRGGDFQHAAEAAARSLALPIFPELEAEEVDHVVGHILEVVTAARRPSPPSTAAPIHPDSARGA